MAKVLKKLDAVQKFVDGYKTYIAAVAILIAGILGEFGITIPPYVWAALGAAGLACLRMAVKKAETAP